MTTFTNTDSIYCNRDDRVRWAIHEAPAGKGYVLTVQPGKPLASSWRASGPVRRYGADTLQDAIEAVKAQGLPHGEHWQL